jgi:LacI family transcriptional regulator
VALTLDKIAREVGVDVSLVSRVLNGDPSARISAEKRAKIVAIAAENNYSPNRMARSLRTRRTRILAMLNPDIINPFYAYLFRSVERTASAAGYDVILCNTDESSARFRHIVETLAEGHVDGLLIATAQETDPAIEWLRERKLPYVLLNRSRKGQSDPWVGSNDFQTGWLGGNHLGKLGHRRIALLTGPPTHNMLARETGFRAALKELGIKPADELMIGNLPNRQSAKTIVESVMALPKTRRPTAFFTPHTQLSDGMLAGLHKAGLRIPADISAVGCSASVTPDITSVWLPIEEIGRVGTEYLLQKLRTADAARDGAMPRIELPVALVDWGSTRAIS